MAEIRLISFHFFVPHFFGTYTTNDTVEVFYDSSTTNLVVRNNGSIITTGPIIPIITGMGRVDRSSTNPYKPPQETWYQTQVCNSGDLFQFVRIAPFPYLNNVILKNSISCIVDTVSVCDLHIDKLVFPTPSDGSSNGAFTLSATSSNTPIKYRLNSDFEYSDSNGQDSPTFSNLPNGKFIVYARDSTNCLDVVSIKVPRSYTYGTRFQIEYYNPCGHHIKTEILERDYSGSLEEITCSEDPTVYKSRGDGSIDKFAPIIAGDMEFNPVSVTNRQFAELQTSDPEKFRLRQSIDTGSGYNIVWTGKILNTDNTESYSPPPYDVQVFASDGLPDLNNIPFFDDDNNQITGEYKQIKIIAWILKKIGFDLNIRSGCNIFATTMATTASDDPLDQAYVDALRYYQVTETPSCYEVLKMILEPYGAQLIQYHNVWNIIRVDEKIDDFAYREYNSNGDYVSNSTYSPVKTIQGPTVANSMHWEGGISATSLHSQPGYGTIQLIYDLGRRKAGIFTNGDFSLKKFTTYYNNVQTGNELIVIPDLSGFQIVNNDTVVIKSSETIENENVALGLTCYERGAYLISEGVTLKMDVGDQIKVTFQFKVLITTPFVARSTNLGLPLYIKVRFVIKYGSYWLNGDGSWSGVYSELQSFVEPDKFNQYQTVSITASAPDATYSDGETIYVKILLPHKYDPDFEAIADLKALTTTTLPIGYRSELYETTSPFSGYYYYKLTETSDAQSYPDVVQPDDYNVSTNKVKWVLEKRTNFIPPAGSIANNTVIFIDKIQVDILVDGKLIPENSAYTKRMETNNNRVLSKIVYHGSLIANGNAIVNIGNAEIIPRPSGPFPDPVRSWNTAKAPTNRYFPGVFETYTYFTANTADLIYTGYLRDSSGVGFDEWTRVGIAESKPLHEILIRSFATQYKNSWKNINGSLYSADTILSPIDTLNDLTGGQDIKTFPTTLEIHYRSNIYATELLELKDATDTAGFSLGFGEGFNA